MSNFRSLLLLSILTSKDLSPQVSLDLSELDEIASLWSIGKIKLNSRERELLEQLLTEFAEELLEPGQKVDFGSFRFSNGHCRSAPKYTVSSVNRGHQRNRFSAHSGQA